MLEIEGKDVFELNDVDLRTLIGLLCEAEINSKGISSVGITFGGHQNAADGGIDVRVELSNPIKGDSYIPRKNTAFQVKKPDMSASEIIKEMKPKGKLRNAIKDIVDVGGAYIIVSSQGSTADTSFKKRIAAMKSAIKDHPNLLNVKLDFYDRERIAGWVRSHPSLVLWIRDKIGKPIQGWKSYDNWSGTPGGVEEKYLIDEHVRIHNGKNMEGTSAVNGINEIRLKLQSPGSSVRLVGLSGVGKTRLLQALFDERIGNNTLNKSQVFYTNLGDSPVPDPCSFAQRLISLKKNSFLVVDNCPPTLHRRLTEICSKSLVSLITVEYDVREDQPEETEVFRLEPSSDELIVKVIRNRYQHIGELNARSIAKFSGGNARIAIALANTIKRGENISRLTDHELFTRLFHQRNETDNTLQTIAEVCSLVYSFDFQTDDGKEEELKQLGSLVDMDVFKIYRNVIELQRRDLVQKRSVWRAVLPHAIANILAQRYLESTPFNLVCNVFEQGSKRLLKSFSKRLSYLHECEQAINITKRWLNEDGILGKVGIGNLNEFEISLLNNIAPINPSLILTVLENVSGQVGEDKFYSRKNPNYITLTRLLQSLAYDKELFNRSAELLCRFALTEENNENINSIRELLKSLFYRELSGTHATPEQRLALISKLTESKCKKKISLGINLLSASLKTQFFSSSQNFEFGSRPRDYGYSPSNQNEVKHWYKTYINYTVSLAVSQLPVATDAKILLAKKFRSLWTRTGMHKDLEWAVKEIARHGPWREGWIAVRSTKRFAETKMSSELIDSLNSLDKLLKPLTLIEKAKLYALSNYSNALDLEDAIEEDINNDVYIQVENTTRNLGIEISLQEEHLAEILPEILSSNDGHRLHFFGEGIAEGSKYPEKTWQQFIKQLSLVEESKRNYQILRGFLYSLSNKNRDLTDELLSKAVTDKILSKIYPILETSIEINEKGIERLKQSLNFGSASIIQYSNLGYVRVHYTINDIHFCDLLRLISSKQGGYNVAIEILEMRIRSQIRDKKLSEEIIHIGQELVLNYPFAQKERNNMRSEQDLEYIIENCFTNPESEENARVLCRKLVKSLIDFGIYSSDYLDVYKALALTHPLVFLDEFFHENIDSNYRRDRIFINNRTPLSQIEDDIIINWCEMNPLQRYPIIAKYIIPYQKGQNEILMWTELAIRILNNTSDPILILNLFRSNFSPWSWSGSLANVLESRLVLITFLKQHENKVVSNWATKEEPLFEELIRSRRVNELEMEKDKNERFEY